MTSLDEYRYVDATEGDAHAYLDQAVFDLLEKERSRVGQGRVFELGCGNGSFATQVAARGFDVVAVDASTSGIDQACRAFSGPRFAVASAYDDLPAVFGQFDIVISLEVVEHLYAPRKWAANLRALLKPDGLAIVSTPYHGYLKNLAIAAMGKLDSHLDPLWDHGHIKFWSIASLTRLLAEARLEVEEVRRVGRLPVLAKSMVLSARPR